MASAYARLGKMANGKPLRVHVEGVLSAHVGAVWRDVVVSEGVDVLQAGVTELRRMIDAGPGAP